MTANSERTGPVFAQPDLTGPAPELRGVEIRANQTALVSDISWRVEYGQRRGFERDLEIHRVDDRWTVHARRTSER
ncbi:hypothetical protein [Nocardia alni]|uniref:hypothetical protein n=1 Tax=Nocardia alni TaxID=2815723 RepID=UPI001C22C5A4|nr:hypothetical protein [Nocardia alni]